ncbi:LysR family transcriptional regulator [Betaproteobacteria bacterium SCN2]|jgi:LysR family transcriptional regulator for metE and metH|nr:LysR family transcriptional regulator [Betaproteobacteria bacterium SCN2]
MIELRHLRTLLALVETGSLTAASIRLHLTQSALSHQVKELEERLGLVLINRGARPLKLTYAGQMLVDLADQVLPKVNETLAGMNRLTRGATGRLYIAGECHSCLEWVLPLLASYRESFPGIELDVVLSASLDPLPRLLDGSLDVVLTPDRRELPGLAWRHLFDYELKLVVAAGHPLSQRSHVAPGDLRGETLLVYPVERARLDIFTRFLWPAGVEPARIRQVEGTTLLLELAALKQGVAILPDWACKVALRDGRISTLTLGSDGLFGSLWASMREAEAGLTHIKGFVDAAIQREDIVTT